MVFNLKPGDKVRFTDYLGEGIIQLVDGETLVVEDENGLVLHLTWKDVVPIFKPEKELPVFRPAQNPKQNIPPAETADISEPEFNWDEPKNAIPKVKDPMAGVPIKDGEGVADIPQSTENRETGIPEIDLHLHVILEDETGMDDYDKLQYQLNTLRKEMNRLRKLSYREIVIVHGVGKGRLRDEVRALLATLPDVVDFFDGSFKKYGAGATQVVFKSLK